MNIKRLNACKSSKHGINSRRIKDSEENGIPCTYYYDLTLDLVNPNTNDRNEPYERCPPELFTDYTDQDGWDNFDDCYDAAIDRAMKYYFEGVELHADDPDIEVKGVMVVIGHIDEGEDMWEDDYDCNLYPKGDDEYFAEHQQFIIV